MDGGVGLAHPRHVGLPVRMAALAGRGRGHQLDLDWGGLDPLRLDPLRLPGWVADPNTKARPGPEEADRRTGAPRPPGSPTAGSSSLHGDSAHHKPHH